MTYKLMPYGRRGKTYSKRTYRGKNRGNRRTRTKSRRSKKGRAFRSIWKNPLTQAAYRKFTYTDSDFVNDLTSTNVTDNYVFRGNSCYDPDVTGTGVQPYGWDEHAPTLFTSYKVAASKITIYITTSADVRHLRCFLVPTRGASLSYNEGSDLSVTPFCKSMVMSSLTSPNRRTKISHYCTAKKLYREWTANDRDYTASYNANPTTPWYWIFTTERNSSIDACYVYFDVKIKYYTILAKTDNRNES